MKPISDRERPGAWRLGAAGLALAALWLLAGNCAIALASLDQSPEKVLVEGQAAALEGQYGRAIRILSTGLRRYPADNGIRLELGRAYLFNRQLGRATALFRAVLAQEPANREAKLGLARTLAYRQDFKASDMLFRELLSADARDEAAAIGLAGNLIQERRRAEAQQVVTAALEYHRDSLRLQEYLDRLQKGELGADEPGPERRANGLETETDYVSDSLGNHSWGTLQRFDYEFIPGVASHAEIEERWLRRPSRPESWVAAGTEQIHFQAANWLTFGLGAGGVRFGDGSARSLYQADVGVHPARRLWFQTGFSRSPFYPDARAAQFDLTTEGWNATADWQPGQWRASAWWAKQHYSDGNLSRRHGTELLRWIGSPRLAVAAGYRYTHYDFKQSPGHGYFSPDEYQSHLGITGLSFHAARRFNAEYLVRVGGESLFRGGPFQYAWELALRNRVTLGRWNVGLDYFYFHLAQSTGAFRAHAGRWVAEYRF
ncbi:MAG TPA: hypothetical protein VGZ29_04215 [Terriglobia bacterium]|nr:hypothetical protein [Terriglobia bacterium]